MGLDIGDIAGLAFGGSSLLGTGLALGGQLMGQEFASDEADANRNFQMNMANTQYQRAVADLRTAGLNPMLAFMKGGGVQGAVPGGSQANSPSNPFAGASLSSAAHVELVHAQAEKAKAEAENIRAQIPVTHGMLGVQNLQMNLLRHQAEQLAAQTTLTDAEKRLVDERIKNAVDTGENIRADTGNIKVDTILKELDVPRARNMAEAQKSTYMREIAPYTGELGKITGSAADAARALRKPGIIPRHSTYNYFSK